MLFSALAFGGKEQVWSEFIDRFTHFNPFILGMATLAAVLGTLNEFRRRKSASTPRKYKRSRKVRKIEIR